MTQEQVNSLEIVRFINEINNKRYLDIQRILNESTLDTVIENLDKLAIPELYTSTFGPKQQSLLQIALDVDSDNKTNLVSLLLEHGADPNLTDWNYRTPLSYLLDATNINITRCSMMLKHGANTTTRNSSGENFLDKIIRENCNAALEKQSYCRIVKIDSTEFNDISSSIMSNVFQKVLPYLNEFQRNVPAEKILKQNQFAYVRDKCVGIIKDYYSLQNTITKTAAYLNAKLPLLTLAGNEHDHFSKWILLSNPIDKYMRHLASQVGSFANSNPVTAFYFKYTLVILDSFLNKSGMELTRFNMRQLLLTSFVVSYKFLHDYQSMDLGAIAKVVLLDPEELIMMEKDFLRMIDFQLPLNKRDKNIEKQFKDLVDSIHDENVYPVKMLKSCLRFFLNSAKNIIHQDDHAISQEKIINPKP